MLTVDLIDRDRLCWKFSLTRKLTNLQWQVNYVRFHCIRGKFKDKLIWPHSNSGLDFIVFSYEED